MKIVIACGGSGGHIFPGIALAQELAKRIDKDRILVICSNKDLDLRILLDSKFNFEAMPYNPFILNFNPLKLFLFFIRLAKALFLSMRLLLKFRPNCVVGFGGYVSGPVIFGAWLLGIPRLIHEQNLIPGLANRIGSLFAQRIAVSFEDTKDFFNRHKVVKVGNPLREDFLNLDNIHSRAHFGLEKDRFTLFITGGSQGSSSLNRVAADMLSSMSSEEKKRLQVIHITGEGDYESVKKRYLKENIKSKVFPFLDEIDRAYTAADLVIARAGATTIAELTYFGKPSILVPYPKKSVHQIENADHLSKNNAAVTIEEKGLSAEKMKGFLLNLIDDTQRLQDMSRNSKRLSNPDAARLLAEEVASLAKQKRC